MLFAEVWLDEKKPLKYTTQCWEKGREEMDKIKPQSPRKLLMLLILVVRVFLQVADMASAFLVIVTKFEEYSLQGLV